MLQNNLLSVTSYYQQQDTMKLFFDVATKNWFAHDFYKLLFLHYNHERYIPMENTTVKFFSLYFGAFLFPHIVILMVLSFVPYQPQASVEVSPYNFWTW